MTVPGLHVTRPADGVALVELDRPHRRNALDRALLDGLPDVVATLAADEGVRALMLTGRGGAFCAGGDLDVIADVEGEAPEQGGRRMTREFATARALTAFPVPTVAAVDGPAVGAGMALALACDVRVGSPAASFATPFVRMALVPDWGVSWLLHRAVGSGRAVDMAVSARRVEAEEALRTGLLDSVTVDPLGTALGIARRWADAPRDVAVATKQLVTGATGGLDEAIDAEIAAQLRAVASPAFARARTEWAAAVRSGFPSGGKPPLPQVRTSSTVGSRSQRETRP